MTNKIADMFISAGVSIGVGARERANCVAYSFAVTVRSYRGMFAVILYAPCRIKNTRSPCPSRGVIFCG